MADVFTAPAILLIGNDPTEQHPLLAWQIRNNVRLHRAKLYVVNSQPIKLRRQATSFMQIPAGAEGKVAAFWRGRVCGRCVGGVHRQRRIECIRSSRASRHKLRGEQNLVIIFGSEIRGNDIASLVKFGSGIAGRESSSASPTTRIRAARRTWGSILTCCPAITRPPAASDFHQEWDDPAEPPASTRRAWWRRARAAS